MGTMEITDISQKIKQIIASVTNKDPQEMKDSYSYKDDLSLDSLSMLEIFMNVSYEFDLNIPLEEFAKTETIQQSARVVQAYLDRI